MSDVLLFVPGLLGSELLDDKGTIWPGSIFNGIVGFNKDRFERLLKPTLKVGGIIERVGYVIDIYAQWMAAFRRLNRNGLPLFSLQSDPPTLYTAPYDWRIDLAVAAEQYLAPTIAKIDQEWKGEATIHIVAHSLGGLLTRHYLQSGNFNGRQGFAAVRTFTTLGTPHNGAPVALAGALGLHATNFLSVDQSTKLASDERYPALYQTFPEFSAPLIWKRTAGGRLESVALSDHVFATEKLKLNDKNLAAALNFRNSIDLTRKPIPKSVRTFLMIGTRFDTITHFFWNGGWLDKVETPDGGDGTVSIQGAFLAGEQMQFTGEAHVDLVSAPEARLALQGLFDAQGLLAAPPIPGEERVVLSVRDRSVDVNGPAHLRIHADGEVRVLQGELIWERATLKDGQTELQDTDFAPLSTLAKVPIRYGGPIAEAMLLRLTAPSMAGIYHLAFKSDNRPESRSEAFVVR
jgi:hypothetical protein